MRAVISAIAWFSAGMIVAGGAATWAEGGSRPRVLPSALSYGISPNGDPLMVQMSGDGLVRARCEAVDSLIPR